MKTIQVSDEMYEFLTDLSVELNLQDNRCTASPYFFQVREIKEVAAHKGSGIEVLYSSEHEKELRTDEEKVAWIKEHEDSFFETPFEDEAREVGHHTMTHELDEMLIELGFEEFYVEDMPVFSNTFLTSKACDEHIRVNGHNLRHPSNYLSHAFRNPELEKVLEFLRGITNDKPHK